MWIYFSAPIMGMLAAVEIYRRVRPDPKVVCAKLDHPDHRRCIHCGYLPDRKGHSHKLRPIGE